jgi:hypothetical protein
VTQVTKLEQLYGREGISPGHSACQGCGALVAVRQILLAAEPPFIVVTPTSCLEVVTSQYPHTAWRVPWVHVAFENAAAVASGIEAALRVLERKGRGRRHKILVIAGDGGTYDIGLQALSGALERRHSFLYVCYDNEAYMNTGIQRSAATPLNAVTTTTPRGKPEPKKGHNGHRSRPQHTLRRHSLTPSLERPRQQGEESHEHRRPHILTCPSPMPPRMALRPQTYHKNRQTRRRDKNIPNLRNRERKIPAQLRDR